jgi:hypothetical protein
MTRKRKVARGPKSQRVCEDCGERMCPVILKGARTVYRCNACVAVIPVVIPFYRMREVFRFRQSSSRGQEDSPGFENAVRVIEDNAGVHSEWPN